MSEEKPVFKITDRRLFNADGSPRDVVREEEPPPAPTPPEPPRAEAAQPRERASEPAGDEPSTEASAPPRARGREAESDDPTPFVNLLMFIASPAASALGLGEPGMPAPEIDPPLAKHCIDLLVTLRQKTRGNLSPREEQVFEQLLAELRMQFVALTSPRPGAPGRGGPRGFTGGDITGGR
ncbi:MAG TPA: DUF1844 domain-containing protein [Pyrinomonadaceae bacterium]|nr:DUF1844 domain-containing protein [Pyrinomonadaceae bacterium]